MAIFRANFYSLSLIGNVSGLFFFPMNESKNIISLQEERCARSSRRGRRRNAEHFCHKIWCKKSATKLQVWTVRFFHCTFGPRKFVCFNWRFFYFFFCFQEPANPEAIWREFCCKSNASTEFLSVFTLKGCCCRCKIVCGSIVGHCLSVSCSAPIPLGVRHQELAVRLNGAGGDHCNSCPWVLESAVCPLLGCCVRRIYEASPAGTADFFPVDRLFLRPLKIQDLKQLNWRIPLIVVFEIGSVHRIRNDLRDFRDFVLISWSKWNEMAQFTLSYTHVHIL